MNELQDTFTITDGYDTRKSPRIFTVRKFTMDDIKSLNDKHEVLFIDNQGKARRCRRSSRLKTWKTDANRFECSFKYGMYENFRMDTADMLNRLIVEV